MCHVGTFFNHIINGWPFCKCPSLMMIYFQTSYDGLLTGDNNMWMEVLAVLNRLVFMITFLTTAVLLGVGY